MIIPKDMTFIRVTTAEDRRNSEVWKKKSGKAKNVCKPVKDIRIRINSKFQVEKAGLVKPRQRYPQTKHCTGQGLRVILLR